MSNLSYWEKRKARETYEALELSEEAIAELKKVYVMASKDIADEVQKIARRFQLKHKLTEKDAVRLLSKLKDKNDINRLIQQLKMNPQTAELAAELEAQAYAARINRLMATQSQVDIVTASIFGRAKKKFQFVLQKIGASAYYHEIFGIQKRANAAFGIIPLDDKRVQSVLNRPWSGESYSKRLWKDTDKLAQTVKEQILIQVLTGKKDSDIAKGIAEKFGSGYNDARRLIRTESCYITNQMALEAYKDTGVDKYIYLAILDLRTSKICQSLDKKMFEVKDAQPGKNFPPMHPWCRSTTMAWMPPEILKRLKQRAWDPKTGKSVTVPGDMTYKEWFDKYVKGNEKNASQAKSAPAGNRNLTREQYDRYKDRLGDDFPFTYDDFIKLKSDKAKWAEYKQKYRDAIKPKPFTDVTDEWKADKPLDRGIVVRKDEVVGSDGNTYRLTKGSDAVEYDHDVNEEEAAKIVSREKGTTVELLPKVNYPKGIKTPDCTVGTVPYEIKSSIRGTSKNTLLNCAKKSKGQSDKLILNLQKCKLSDDEIKRQIPEILKSTRIGYINEIVIVWKDTVYGVFSRQ